MLMKSSQHYLAQSLDDQEELEDIITRETRWKLGILESRI